VYATERSQIRPGCASSLRSGGCCDRNKVTDPGLWGPREVASDAEGGWPEICDHPPPRFREMVRVTQRPLVPRMHGSKRLNVQNMMA